MLPAAPTFLQVRPASDPYPLDAHNMEQLHDALNVDTLELHRMVKVGAAHNCTLLRCLGPEW